MKNHLIKFLVCLNIIILIVAFSFGINATSTSIDRSKDSRKAVENFLSYLEYGSAYTFNYIDSSNYELYSKTQERLRDYSEIDFTIKNVKEIGYETYKVEVTVSAEGTKSGSSVDWKVGNTSADFEVKYVNGACRIVNTNFFEKTSPEYIAGTVFLILAVVFGILGIVFVGIVITVIIVVVVVSKKKKNK